MVGGQSGTGVHDVDDFIGQAHHRRQFHRAVELDDIHLPPLGGIVAARDIDVFGGDPQSPRLGLGAERSGGHQPAAGDAQIHRLVIAVATTVLHQHVLAGDTEICGAELYIGGHVRAAQHQQAQAG